MHGDVACPCSTDAGGSKTLPEVEHELLSGGSNLRVLSDAAGPEEVGRRRRTVVTLLRRCDQRCECTAKRIRGEGNIFWSGRRGRSPVVVPEEC
jgi:hypothetical protein